MIALRSLVLCVSVVGLVSVVGACDGGDEDATSGMEEQEESETTQGEETESESDATGDGDGDGEGTGDGDGDAESEGDSEGLGCEVFDNGTSQSVIAATSAGEAATAPIVPDASVVYEISLPADAAGFVELQIADWETTQSFFTNEDIDYTVTTSAQAQEPGPREPLASCPDAGATSQSFFFPHWTPATLEFSATGPREIRLVVIQEG